VARRAARPHRAAERGQATVELAVAMPLLIGTCALVAQVGLVAADRVALEHAAHVAARAAAAADVAPDAVAQVARAAALARLDDDELAVEAVLDGARVVVTLRLPRTVGLAPIAPLRHAVALATTASAPREPVSAGAE
jgi:Flp pilus assembly protein TadG